MVGGPPIFMPQHMAPQHMPPQAAPAMPRQGIPPHMQAGNYVPPRLTPPAKTQPVVQQPVAQQPAARVMRGVRPTEPEDAPVSIPTPEELGIVAAGRAAPSSTPIALDWAATRRQLSELGVTRFQVEPLSNGGARFSCWLGSQVVQVDAASEAEAVRLCLARAQQQLASRR